MTQFLPYSLLRCFRAREPLSYSKPLTKLRHERPRKPDTGLAQFLHHFENPRRSSREQMAELEEQISVWNQRKSESSGDPLRTLFIGRLDYSTIDDTLRHEFEVYGPLKKVEIVRNKHTGKSRGYAFVEFENVENMHAAFKNADGKKIDGRLIVVDIERGRTQSDWLPRRLGGGLGKTRAGSPDINETAPGRDSSINWSPSLKMKDESLQSSYPQRNITSMCLENGSVVDTANDRIAKKLLEQQLLYERQKGQKLMEELKQKEKKIAELLEDMNKVQKFVATFEECLRVVNESS